MPYTISPYRTEFDTRTNALRVSSYDAHSSKNIPLKLRDLVFQASILQSSAAIEDYIKSLFDAWAFKTKAVAPSSVSIPIRTRVSMAKDTLSKPFYHYAATGDEAELIGRLERQSSLWELLEGSKPVPGYFEGSSVYKDRKYPSPKNLKVLFYRIGVDGIFDRASQILQSDAEMKLVSFNSVRTALAHAQPPQLTYLDVRRNITDVQGLIRAFDRVTHQTLASHMGQAPW